MPGSAHSLWMRRWTRHGPTWPRAPTRSSSACRRGASSAPPGALTNRGRLRWIPLPSVASAGWLRCAGCSTRSPPNAALTCSSRPPRRLSRRPSRPSWPASSASTWSSPIPSMRSREASSRSVRSPIMRRPCVCSCAAERRSSSVQVRCSQARSWRGVSRWPASRGSDGALPPRRPRPRGRARRGCRRSRCFSRGPSSRRSTRPVSLCFWPS